MGSHLAALLAQRLDLTGVERVLDVGGGFGHYCLALRTISPSIRATALDRPEVVALTREQDTGLEFIAGDYLDSDYGGPHDLVLIANVLHQEAGDRAARLIQRAAGALRTGGRLVVLDFSIDPHKEQQLVGALFAINMRSFGDTHSEPEIRGWMEAAGLGRVERVDLSPMRWLIIGHR